MDNWLSEVTLSLPNLVLLNLGNNFLQSIPSLSKLPKLQKFLLNANNIQEAQIRCKDANYINLLELSLKNNKITFLSETSLSTFCKKLGKFTALSNLNLENNPFHEDKKKQRQYFLRI
jgi:Leucine-rich repeat (LRR) protein